MRTSLIVGLMTLAGVAGAAGPVQQLPSAPTTFRAGVELVEVDVAVLDRDRRPVRGLTAADFTILEDGKPRPVAAFTAIDLPARAADAPGAAWTRQVSPDIATNTLPDEGRLIVILMDITISNGAGTLAARDIAKAAINEMGAGDVAAIVSPLGVVAQDFTNDRARLTAAVDGTYPSAVLSAEAQAHINNQMADLATAVGRDLVSPESGECYCGVCTHKAITRVADAMREVPRRRKSLLVLGANIVVLPGNNPCSATIKQAMDELFRALDLSNLTVHWFDSELLQPLNLGAGTCGPRCNPVTASVGLARANMERQGNISVLSDRTGGRLVKNTNAPEKQVTSILHESDSYYLLGFVPAAPADGNQHAISVKVNRKGLNVRTRQGYLATAQPPAPAEPALAATDGIVGKRRGISLTAAASVFATPAAEKATVAVAIAARHDPPALASTPTRVDLVTRILKMSGEVVGTLRQTAEVLPQPGAAMTPNYEIVQRLSLAPGTYELRLGLSDAARHESGSVYAFVDVPRVELLRLTVSDIAMQAASSRPAAFEPLADVVPFLPTARRDFSKEDRLSAFVQIHPGGVTPSPVSVTTRIVDAQDRQRYETTTSVTPADRVEPFPFSFDVPTSDLEAGPYLLTLDAKSGSSSVRRQVRFSIK